MQEQSPVAALSMRKLLPFAMIMVVAVVGYFTLRDYLSFATLRDNRDSLMAFTSRNYALSCLAFVALYVVIVAFSLPGAAIASLTGGFLFGLFPGSLMNVAAATSGAGIIFLAARYGLGAQLSRRMDASEGAIRHFKEGLRKNEWSYLFLMRLVPAVPFFVANLIPALVGVSLARFLVTTFFGIIPGALVYTWIGSGLGEVFARGETPDLGLIFQPKILLPILFLSVLAALPIAFGIVNKRGSKE